MVKYIKVEGTKINKWCAIIAWALSTIIALGAFVVLFTTFTMTGGFIFLIMTAIACYLIEFAVSQNEFYKTHIQIYMCKKSEFITHMLLEDTYPFIIMDQDSEYVVFVQNSDFNNYIAWKFVNGLNIPTLWNKMEKYENPELFHWLYNNSILNEFHGLF